MMCVMMTICNPGDKVMVFFPPFMRITARMRSCPALPPIYIPLVPPEYTFDLGLIEKGLSGRSQGRSLSAIRPIPAERYFPGKN